MRTRRDFIERVAGTAFGHGGDAGPDLLAPASASPPLDLEGSGNGTRVVSSARASRTLRRYELGKAATCARSGSAQPRRRTRVDRAHR